MKWSIKSELSLWVGIFHGCPFSSTNVSNETTRLGDFYSQHVFNIFSTLQTIRPKRDTLTMSNSGTWGHFYQKYAFQEKFVSSHI